MTSQNGRSVFSGGMDGKVFITSISIKPGSSQEYTIFAEELLSAAKPILAMALSPDERMLAVAQPSMVVVLDLRTRLFLYKMTRIDGRVTALAWDPQGQILAIGRASGDVLAWNILSGSAAGEDSREALEVYSSGTSPIVGIAFHPSSRVFFAAESSGTISIWRLMRTEVEMGLRDSWAVVDQLRTTTKRKAFARVRSQIKDIWLDHEGTVIFVAAADGSIFRWKVRGLALREPLRIGEDAVFSISGVDLSSKSGVSTPILVSADRSQRLRFWCAINSFESLTSAITGVDMLDSTVAPAATDDDTLAVGSLNDDGFNTETLTELAEQQASELASIAAESNSFVAQGNLAIRAPRETQDEALVRRLGLIAQSEILKTPASMVRIGEKQPFLWASQKTGSLVVFDFRLLLSRSADWSDRINSCEGWSK